MSELTVNRDVLNECTCMVGYISLFSMLQESTQNEAHTSNLDESALVCICTRGISQRCRISNLKESPLMEMFERAPKITPHSSLL